MAVANSIDTAVNARAFAVPNREHAIVISIAEHTGLLRAPNRSGGKIPVDRRQKMDVEIRRKRCPPRVPCRDCASASRDIRK